MKNWTQKILIAMFSALLLAGCSIEPSAEELLVQAEELENKGNYKEAILILDNAIKKDPNFLGAYINRGADYSMLGDYEEAIKNYQQVLKRDYRNQLALLNIGNNYCRLNKYREAVDVYTDILTDDNGNPMPELIVTDANGNIGEFKVRFYDVKYERGLALYELQSWDSSFVDFNYCVQSNYMIPDSRYMLGAIYEIYGMNDEACKEYRLSANLGDEYAKDGIKRVCNK
jgi:tetratricopeptide (TPR) repeat protein